MRQRLADTLRYIVSQRLAPKQGGGRVLVDEIMGNSLRTREAILLGESEVRDLHQIIEDNHQNGWHSFEQTLIKHFRDNKISEDTAMLYSVNKPEMRKKLDVVKKEIAPSDDAPKLSTGRFKSVLPSGRCSIESNPASTCSSTNSDRCSGRCCRATRSCRGNRCRSCCS